MHVLNFLHLPHNGYSPARRFRYQPALLRNPGNMPGSTLSHRSGPILCTTALIRRRHQKPGQFADFDPLLSVLLTRSTTAISVIRLCQI